MNNRIRQIDLNKHTLKDFKAQHVGCLILTKEKKLLLQQRSDTCFTYPGFISTFGGKIELDESPTQALVRELNEELGATVLESDIVFIGAVTEAITNHTELVYEYFWHDKQDSITGCYEESPCYFDDMDSALQMKPKLMDDVVWVLGECQKHGFLNK